MYFSRDELLLGILHVFMHCTRVGWIQEVWLRGGYGY